MDEVHLLLFWAFAELGLGKIPDEGHVLGLWAFCLT